MTKALTLFSIFFVLLVGCQSKEDELKALLGDNLVQYLRQEQLAINGSANIDTCLVISVDSVNEKHIDSLMLAKIRVQRAVYDSLADDNLKRGNDFNHLAYNYHKSGDITKFNLAVLNATDYHYQAGSFIDSSMAIQKTAEFLRHKTNLDSSVKKYFEAKVFLKATLFSTTDSVKIRDTLLFHFNRANEVVDLNKKLASLIRYE